MRVDLPLDKKMWKIRTGPLGLRATEQPGRWAPGARGRGPRAAGPSDRRAAGPSQAVGRGPAFSKTHRRAHKRGRNSHPRTMRLFRLIIYVENKENLTYIASSTTTTKKKPGYPHFFKKQPALLYHAATNNSHTQKTMKS